MARPRIAETAENKAQRIRQLILVRALRTALGYSQREFARLVGVHFSALARFESGRLRLKQDHITRIMAIFEQAGITISESDRGDLIIRLQCAQIDALATDTPDEGDDTVPGFRL